MPGTLPCPPGPINPTTPELSSLAIVIDKAVLPARAGDAGDESAAGTRGRCCDLEQHPGIVLYLMIASRDRLVVNTTITMTKKP